MQEWTQQEPPPPAEEPPQPPEEEQQLFFVQLQENFAEVVYLPNHATRGINGFEVPASWAGMTHTLLKPHQDQGTRWLCQAWKSGLQGVLLADDMGLGKTLQALTFLAWLRTNGEQRPFLVVAPTGLLSNWEQEIQRHLEPGVLDPLLRVHGQHLRSLRTRPRGADLLHGEPGLDTNRIQEASLVLTSYETLRDYHLSFLPVVFAVALFDEAQKVKNPASQVAQAAKSVNANFIITMTGTPVENRLEDIWAIMDLTIPGFLGDLKSFSTNCRADDPDSLRQLHHLLTTPSAERPAVMLRRMKHEHLKNLPEKKSHSLRENMPQEQAQAYQGVIRDHPQGRKGAMLETLHRLRGVSLHPLDPRAFQQVDDPHYIAMSARFRAAFKVLDQVSQAGEKALIFLEDLAMQDLLAQMIKHRFQLTLLPLIINGKIVGQSRQNRVNAFQDPARLGFDVMILSPRAGGVGLTLTAANHVIHLSRWWNPAIEDQCTDRAYRIGQESTVHVHYPMAIYPDDNLAPFSFDLKLDALLQRKRTLSQQMLIPPVLPGVDEQELFEAVCGGAANHPDRAIEEIDSMEPRQFEEWALQRFMAAGYNFKRTAGRGDGGADGIFTHPNTDEQVIVQCKLRQPNAVCGTEAVDDLLRARTAWQIPNPRLIALTNAKGFSGTAFERAARNDVELVARNELLTWQP